MTKTPLDRFVRGRRPRCRIYTGEINSAFIKIVHCKDQRLTACHCMVEVDQDCSLARRKNSTLVSAAALHTPLPQRVIFDISSVRQKCPLSLRSLPKMVSR